MVVRDNEMVLSSGRADFGEGQEILPVTFEGEPIAIGFSAFYIADLLSAMPKSDEVLIKLDGTAAPVLFQSPSDDHYLGVIMPMRF
jgi:DNA polymerase-3 subunit beta